MFCCHFPGFLRYLKLLAYFLQTCCLEKKNINLFSEVRIQFPSFLFFCPVGNALSCFSHSFIAVQNALKYVLIQMLPLSKCWKYLPKADSFIFSSFFCTYSTWSLHLGSTKSGFLEFLSSLCLLAYYGVVQFVRLPASFSHPAPVQQRRNCLSFHKLHNTLRTSTEG